MLAKLESLIEKGLTLNAALDKLFIDYGINKTALRAAYTDKNKSASWSR